MKGLKYFLAAAALLPLSMVAPVSAVINTSPGKAAVFVSGPATVTTSTTALLSGSLLKGKRKHVLQITATAIGSVTGTSNAIGVKVRVNGFATEPNGGLFTVSLCNASYYCSGATHAFVDLDAAELLHPGMFIGQPLTIDVDGAIGSGTMSATVSIQARLQKK